MPRPCPFLREAPLRTPLDSNGIAYAEGSTKIAELGVNLLGAERFEALALEIDKSNGELVIALHSMVLSMYWSGVYRPSGVAIVDNQTTNLRSVIWRSGD